MQCEWARYRMVVLKVVVARLGMVLLAFGGEWLYEIANYDSGHDIF